METVGDEQKLSKHSRLQKWDKLFHHRHLPHTLAGLCRCRSHTFLLHLLVRRQISRAQLRGRRSKLIFLRLHPFQRQTQAS